VTPFVYHSPVRFVDTDASERIHYTAMLRHFEAAEDEFMRALGCHYSGMESGEVGYPRVHVECDYTGEVVFGDVLAIAVTVERVGATSFTLAYDATVEGRRAARGRIVIVSMDRGTKRASEMDAGLAAALRAHQR
jgi:YbgC/YbaW family acyl-CoA thioester hydrolase